MNGAQNIVGRWQGEGDDAVVEAGDIVSAIEMGETADTEAPPSRDRLPIVTGALAALAAAGWLAVVWLSHAASFADGVALTDVMAATRDASAPLVLIAVAYLVVIRASRSEGARLAQVTGMLREEQSRLDSAMTSVSERIETQRIELAAQSDQLMTLGEDAASRLHAVAQKLKGDIDAASRDAQILQSASQAARGDMTALLADLPRAHAQTVAMTTALGEAGLLAHERAGALDSQIAALVARGREADEIAGGAAQKLAAHLARVEGVSESAGAQLSAAAETMTLAIDAALGRAATAGGAARQAMDAQAAAMIALVDQSEAALTRTGGAASEAIAQRVADLKERLETLGSMLADHEVASTKLLYGISSGIDAVDERFAAIDVSASARHQQLTTTLGNLATQAQSLTMSLDTGGLSAETMISKTETLMTALDATTREIEETLPNAFGRLDSRIEASRAKIAEVAPEVARIEREASAALDRLLAAEKLLTDQRTALDALGTALDARLKASAAAASDLVAAVEGADARANAIAQGAGTTLVEAMVRVREAAQTAADRAREALAAVVPDSADRLSIAVKKALGEAVTGQVEAHIGELAATAERAVGSANAASDRLVRQMLTIAETSALVESRIAEARTEIDEADRDNFSRRVALLIESLNSTAIDVTKIMSNDVTDSAWNAYLKGDRGVFTRRAVRLLDTGEAREIVRHYNDDPEFREQVNRYVHDFEGMLRNVLATRAGSPLGVTLLSSDMGKLYVALAQAIERLRS